MAEDIPIISTEAQLVALRDEFNRRWRASFEKEDKRTAELLLALEKYGVHKYECATNGTAKSPVNAFPIVNPGPCNCGLDKALKGDL